MSLLANDKTDPVRRVSAADEVFNILHGWILSGKLELGDKLPSQDKLAVQLGVSRNTLREAIYKLTVLGLLKAKQGVGTVVSKTTASDYMTSLSDHLLLDPTTAMEFIEARMFIEKNTVQLAAIRATQKDVSHLKDIIRRQEKAFENGNINNFGEMDTEFHLTLARTSKNSVLAKFLEIIREILKKFILEVSQLPGSVTSAINFHKQILEHIIKHDSEKAGEMMMRHLLDVTKRIEQNLNVQMDADDIFNAVKDLEGDKYSNI